jgi:hypothetical protein
MKPNKFNTFNYWYNYLCNSTQVWQGAFNRKPGTGNSIILHVVIVNQTSSDFIDAWSYFPHTDSLLGFINYIHLPAVFFSWFNRDAENFIIPIDVGVVELVSLISEQGSKEEDVREMKSNIEEIKSLWLLSHEERIKGLRAFCKRFNDKWDNHRELVFFSIDVFESPIEVAESMIKSYEEEGMAEELEEKLGIAKGDWLQIANRANDNEFMWKRFFSILNKEDVEFL